MPQENMVRKEDSQSLRGLQERLDSVLPHLNEIESALQYQVHGPSTEPVNAQGIDTKAGNPNMESLHSSMQSIEATIRTISELTTSLIGT